MTAPAAAQTRSISEGVDAAASNPAFLAGSVVVVILLSLVAAFIFRSPRLHGSSLFNRLFVIVATSSAFFSAVSSAIGFSLLTSQETSDFFRNAVLPPAFGVFTFFLAATIWIGGAAFVRERDWFRDLGAGFIRDIASFIERAIKLFVIIPTLALILFFVSTWTTVVGVGGVDAVRFTYTNELQRLQNECAGITSYRQRDFLFLEDLRLAVSDVTRAADAEAIRGDRSGQAGRGPIAGYFTGVAQWLGELEQSVAGIIDGADPTGVNPYDPQFCSSTAERLEVKLAANAFENYDLWQRELESDFNDTAVLLNRWRRDRRIEQLLELQLASFARANPIPARLNPRQETAIENYAGEIEKALKSLIRKQRSNRPPQPLPSADEVAPERGIAILQQWFAPPDEAPVEEKRISRTQKVIFEQERVAPLSSIGPRDAVLKNANVFSDIWALALAWDYASYILMFAFLFFPSAERASGYKEQTLRQDDEKTRLQEDE